MDAMSGVRGSVLGAVLAGLVTGVAVWLLVGPRIRALLARPARRRLGALARSEPITHEGGVMRPSRRIAAVLAAGCALAMAPALGAAGSDDDTDRCLLTGSGTFDNGDTFEGEITGSVSHAEGGWTHRTTDGRVIELDPDWLGCRINGADIADAEGPGTLDGQAGYTVDLQVRDFTNSTSPVEERHEVQTVTATRTYRPSAWQDGTVAIDGQAWVTIPAKLPVTVGNAGNQWARLTFARSDDGSVGVCRFRGGASVPNPVTPEDVAAGEHYHLERCTDDSDDAEPLGAGDRVRVSAMVLRVQHGDGTRPSVHAAATTVSVDLDVTHLGPTIHNVVRLTVWDPDTEERVLRVEGDVVEGEVRVFRRLE